MSPMTTELAELGRFFLITGRRLAAGSTAPEMFSDAIDSAWHSLIDDATAHEEFTIAHAGRALIHVEGRGEGLVSWVSAYEDAYGPLPEIWFTDASGAVNSESLAHYRSTGEVRASWNCSPEAAPTSTKANPTAR
ncbi:hypothetical protein [Kitasatospora sp. NPDC059327]|uniref:hypothetical protein n=1 Tax=Kitasatospora sp. NPDC059327 TaxID=3346803 RepID=UPI00367CC91E